MELNLVEEREPSVLEYARFYNLCKDYTTEQFIPGEIRFQSSMGLDMDLSDPNDATPFTNPTCELLHERFAVSKDAAMLLKSVHSLQETPNHFEPIPDKRRQILALKQELPILQTDNELDMLNFGSVMDPSFADFTVPLDAVNTENDDEDGWLSDYNYLPTKCDDMVKNEKLTITKETLYYLQDITSNFYVPKDTQDILIDGYENHKKSTLEPLTPPLLPLTPPLTPYLPSSPNGCIEILSETSNSTTAEAKALEEQIMKTDTIDFDGRDPMLLEMMESNDLDLALSTIDPPAPKRRAQDLKVEGPLTPSIFSESPAKKLKSVAFADMLVEYIPELPSNCENGDVVLNSEDDSAFYQVMEASAKEANWKVENEKLSEADTTKRVPVPQLDLWLPATPWDEFKRTSGDETEIDAQMKFILLVQRDLPKSAGSWHGVSALDMKLPVAPFPVQSAKVAIEEKLHGDEFLSNMLTDLAAGEIVTSSTDMWKKDGLRLLDDKGIEEEELEPADFQGSDSMVALVRKRKVDMDSVNCDSRPKRNAIRPTLQFGQQTDTRIIPASHCCMDDTQVPQVVSTPRTVKEKPIRISKQQQAESDKNFLFGGTFSASNALDRFIALNGMSVKPRKATEKPQAVLSRASGVSSPYAVQSVSKPGSYPTEQSASIVPNPVPSLPALPESLPPCSFVISFALLQQRSLSKNIEKLYANAEFVSRTYDASYAIAPEADLILSPSTGLIIVTLQQVKQRALPGQPDRSPTKERISALYDRYERLVVMISEGVSQEREKQESTGMMDSRDQEAIAEFKNLAAQMNGEVLIRYVPGGNQALARSIVAEMARFGLPHGSADIGDIKPLCDETNWELFLRRAGLNPFAAQVILALLRNPVDYPLSFDSCTETISTFGLQTLLMMSAEQRVRNFQAIMGGSRILNKVNALLDQEWVSAAHGFRI